MKEAILLILKIPENPTVWEYAWFQLPYSLPGIFTFLLGIFLTYVSILSFLKKPKEDRIFFFHLSLCFLGNGILGLVLALRAIILDKELLLLFNNHLYIFVMLLTPSGFCIAYYITGKKSKSIAVYSIICWISYFLGVFDVFRFHAFQNEWLDYPFGFYPKANLFVSLWGVLPAIGFFLFVIPNTIQFVKSKKPNLNIPVLLGLNLLFFLPFTNLPSILGYKFYPGANFLFVPMLIFAFGVFRSDFLDINELLFQKRGLFYVITGFFSLLFIAIFLCIIAFLQPTAGGKLYSKPYFLVPLFSGFCLFFLAIYIAGNNPNEKINIMASLSLVTNGAYTIVLTTLALELPQIVCHRIQQLSYLLFTLAPSIQLRLVFLVMRLPAPKYMRFIDIASVTMLIWSQTPYFFGEGYYSYSYGYIAQSGPGLFLFGLLGFISVFLVFYHYWTNRKSESTGATRLIVWAFGLGGFLNLLNLPSTQGIKFYPLGTMQWIPACMIAYSVLKFGAVRVKGDAEAIGNRISILTFLGIPVIMLGYYLLIPNDIAPFPKIMHITLAMTPMFLAFYSFTFILIRPISEKLDDNFQALKREKQISEQAKLEIEMLNHFTYLINSKSNLKDIFVEISMFMYAKYSIKAAWLFLLDEKREYLYAYKAYSYDKLPQEQYDYMMNLKVPLNEKGGMMFLSFKRKKPFYLPKIRKFEFEFDREIAEALALTSFLHVPLVSKDECVGIFAFSNLGSELHLKRNEISSIENLCSQIAGVIKTTHLLYQVEQTKSEVEFLNDIIQNVNSVSTLTDIMTFVIYHVEMKYGKMTFWLLITDRENTKLSTFSYNPPVLNDEITKYFKNLTIPLAKETGTIIQAYKNQVPYYSKISEIEYLSELDKDLISQGNWDYLFYIPLVVYEEVVGILFLHKDGGEFSLKERIELQRLGEQISGAIQNAQLLQITAEAKEEIDKLNELTQLLNSTTDISAIFKEIYNYLNQTMGFDQCWPLLVDKNKNELYTDKNMTLLEKILFFDVDFFLNFRMKLDESLGTLYQTYTKKVPLCIPDTSQTVEGTRTHIINQFNGEVYIGNKTDLKINSKGKLKSVFHFPLILQNEVIGILCISAFNKIKEVSKEDIQKLMRFSDQIAGVIYNAQLLKETEMAKKET
ncbi:MAG: GAF domain-containing protein, partial [Leptospiraceae bacterium]|nr:GAF domain-containing protein [Leptospiraceae bacterium]